MENQKHLISQTDVNTPHDIDSSIHRVRGVVSTTIKNSKNESKDCFNNMILLSGREFLAQKLSDTTSSIISKDIPIEALLKDFKIRYFGIGNGGATETEFSTKIGPFENDIDLNNAGNINNTYSIDDNYKYIHNGLMKRIESDGSIEILSEDHTLSVNGEQVNLSANTTIKFKMVISEEEVPLRPFCFNEAALYAVHHDEDTVYGASSASKVLAEFVSFSRFTTLNKYLEPGDSLTIEWYILV